MFVRPGKMPCDREPGANVSEEPEPPASRDDTHDDDDDRAFHALVQDLRTSWKFPAVVRFCRVFEGPLRLRPFSSERLERALVRPHDHPLFLAELLYKLMTVDRRQPFQVAVASEKWEAMLADKLRRCAAQLGANSALHTQPFHQLDPLRRLEVLYFLTEKLVRDSASIKEAIKTAVDDQGDAVDALRTLPIGEDAQGSKYYVFAAKGEDCRLYRQDFCFPRKTSRKAKPAEDLCGPTWTTLCTTLEDVTAFVEELEGTQHTCEKQLHKTLAHELLPEWVRTDKLRRRAEERADHLEKAPLKRSSRIQELTKRRGGARSPAEEEAASRDELTVDSLGKGARQDPEWSVDGHVDRRSSAPTGPSREERMRLRNERKERVERGEALPEVAAVGEKRRWATAFDWNPLGAEVKCNRMRRVHRTKAPRTFRRLEDVGSEKFGVPDQIRAEFCALVEDPRQRVRLLGLAIPLISHRPTSNLRSVRYDERGHAALSMKDPHRSANQSLIHQQLLVRHRQLLQQHQERQQQHQQQFQAFHGQGAAQSLATPLHQAGSFPMSSTAFQQQLQNCFNKLPESQKELVVKMPPMQRNQVLTDLVRSELAHQRVQEQQRHGFHAFQTYSGMHRPSQSNSAGLDNLVAMKFDESTSFHQVHQGQTFPTMLRRRVAPASLSNPTGLKQEALPGVVIQQQLSGRPMTIRNSGGRRLPQMGQRLVSQQSYLLGSGQAPGGSLHPHHNHPYSPPVLHSTGSAPLRQSHESPMVHVGGTGSHGLSGLMVPVANSVRLDGASANPKIGTQSSGNTSANNQSGQGIVRS